MAVTSGPGVTNVLTPVADAYFDGIPMLVFTDQVGTGDLTGQKRVRQSGFQEVDTPSLMKPITKGQFQPKNSAELYAILPIAWQLALEGRRGPVPIDLPMDVQRSAATESINVAYGSTAGSTIGTSYTLQTFTASEIDTHGCWNGTDTFTAQLADYYKISAGILTAAVTLTTAQSITLAVYKNGSLYRNIARAVGNGASIAYMLNGDDFIYLKSQETLQIYAVCSVATSQSSSGANNRVSITRVK